MLCDWVFDDLQGEYHSAMLHEDMNIYKIMAHDHQLKESRAKSKNKDAKRI